MEPNQNPQPQSTPNPTAGPTAQSTPATAEPIAQAAATVKSMDKKKVYGVLGYAITILFFLPLIDEQLKTDPSARFHANQQLVLLITGFVLQFIAAFVIFPVIGPTSISIGSIVNLFTLVLTAIGVLNVIKNQDKELPIIGQFHILK